jgi:hypothetical protein
MFSDYSRIKKETNNKKDFRKIPNIWKLSSIVLNNTQARKNQKET